MAEATRNFVTRSADPKDNVWRTMYFHSKKNLLVLVTSYFFGNAEHYVSSEKVEKIDVLTQRFKRLVCITGDGPAFPLANSFLVYSDGTITVTDKKNDSRFLTREFVWNETKLNVRGCFIRSETPAEATSSNEFLSKPLPRVAQKKSSEKKPQKPKASGPPESGGQNPPSKDKNPGGASTLTEQTKGGKKKRRRNNKKKKVADTVVEEIREVDPQGKVCQEETNKVAGQATVTEQSDRSAESRSSLSFSDETRNFLSSLEDHVYLQTKKGEFIADAQLPTGLETAMVVLTKLDSLIGVTKGGECFKFSKIEVPDVKTVMWDGAERGYFSLGV